MKYTSTFSMLLVVLNSFFQAQGQPLVTDNIIVFEHFTNASCGPCAAQNPGFQAILANNADKAASVKYHVNWPGTDPMHNFNPTDPMDRRAFYGITGVPSVRLSNQPNMSPAGITNTVINNLFTAVQPAFTYNITTNIANDTLFVSGQIVRFRPLNFTNLRFHAIVVEDPVNYTTPPGSNGEKDFASVVRKMLPNAQGTQLGNGATAVSFNFAYPIPALLDQSRLYLVAFVQDHDTQTAYRGVKIKAGSSFATSTAELSSKNLQIWPNPAQDQLKLRFAKQSNPVNLMVFGLDGRQHQVSYTNSESTSAEEFIIDLTKLPEGFYTILIQNTELILHGNFLKRP